MRERVRESERDREERECKRQANNKLEVGVRERGRQTDRRRGSRRYFSFLP